MIHQTQSRTQFYQTLIIALATVAWTREAAIISRVYVRHTMLGKLLIASLVSTAAASLECKCTPALSQYLDSMFATLPNVPSPICNSSSNTCNLGTLPSQVIATCAYLTSDNAKLNGGYYCSAGETAGTISITVPSLDNAPATLHQCTTSGCDASPLDGVTYKETSTVALDWKNGGSSVRCMPVMFAFLFLLKLMF